MRFGFTEVSIVLLAGSPATGEGFAALPTKRPEGASPVSFEVDPPPFSPARWAPLDAEPVTLLADKDPGAPDAPVCPSGVAANVPRRLPAGGSGGAFNTGCTLRAITRPGDPVASDVESEGGGGAICGAPCVGPPRPPGIVRWAATGS